MSYTIRELDYDSPGEQQQAVDVANEALGLGIDWPGIELWIQTRATRPRVILGAYEGDRLVALNAFIAHDLMHRGALVPCYQSCWTATAREHRGKGLFSRIVNHAKEQFRAGGIGLLFGFPNEQSAPIFHTTLGFRSLGGFFHVRIPNLPGAVRLAVRSPSRGEWLLTQGGYGQNDAQLVEHKRRKLGARFAEFEQEGNYLWGRVSSARGLRVLEVGGVILNDPCFLAATIEGALRAQRAHFVRLLPHVSSLFSRFFRYGEVSPHASHLIVCDLNERADEYTTFNFWNGVIDVF